MHCNGKCYLKKQLKKVDESKQGDKDFPLSVLKIKAVDNFIVQQGTACMMPKIISFSQNTFGRYPAIFILRGYYGTTFHPPKFSRSN